MDDSTSGHADLTPAMRTNGRYEQTLDLATRVAHAMYAGWPDVDRENLVSEVMVKYWQTFDRGPGPDNERAWLSRVIRTTAIDVNRGDRRRPADPAGDLAADLDPTHAWVDGWLRVVEKLGPSKAIAASHLMDEILDLLGPRDRELITRKYLFCDSTREIAQVLDSSEAATSQAISRAKRRLSTALIERPALLKELRAAMPQIY